MPAPYPASLIFIAGNGAKRLHSVFTIAAPVGVTSSTCVRGNFDRFRYTQKLRNSLARLVENLPDEFQDLPELEVLRPVASAKAYNIVQLIYRAKGYEGDYKDYEFSRLSMEEHWRDGYHDTVRMLRHPEVLQRSDSSEGVLTFDLGQHGRE